MFRYEDDMSEDRTDVHTECLKGKAALIPAAVTVPAVPTDVGGAGRCRLGAASRDSHSSPRLQCAPQIPSLSVKNAAQTPPH